MLKYAQKLFDTAGIVREAIFRHLPFTMVAGFVRSDRPLGLIYRAATRAANAFDNRPPKHLIQAIAPRLPPNLGADERDSRLCLAKQ
jgi:hypothetical protein